MSGIAGIYYLDGRPAKRADLERMVASIRHRGPDGSGVWCNGPVGLGHALLHSTPEALYEQSPMQDASGQLVITADVRLDNREEVLAALDFDLSEAGKIPDSRLILAAYEKWGQRCPEKLLGDFAFAIWDNRRQLFFCARDHVGAKPFYYYLSGRTFIFGSEIKVLLTLPEVPRRLNEEALLGFFQPILPRNEVSSWYREIYQLPSRHVLTVAAGGTNLRSYWSPADAPELPFQSDQEYAEAFGYLFREAVRCRLRSVGRTGVMLSGGVDSSSVACTAYQISGPARVQAFSLVNADSSQSAETPFIQAVIRHTGISSRTIRSDQMGRFIAEMEDIFNKKDEPPFGGGISIPRVIYCLAREHGVRAVLDGHDGDGLISLSLEYQARLLWEGKWLSWLQDARGLAKRFQRPLWKVLLRHGALPLIPEPLKKAWLLVRPRLGTFDSQVFDVNPLLNPEFAKRTNLKERLQELSLNYLYITRTAREEALNYLYSGVLSRGLGGHELTAGAIGLESRHPIADKRLVEFCLALPQEQKIFRGWSKMVLRRAMTGTLPEEVRWRPDRNNEGTSFYEALLSSHQENSYQEIWDNPKVPQDYMDAAALNHVRQRYKEHRMASDAFILWRISHLAKWLGNLS